MSRDRAILASGCFWGAQELLRKKPGVISSRAGYSGGSTPNATYRDHGDHDVGRSYRSAIFSTGDEQKRVALDTIKDVDASGLWPGKVVTEVKPAGDFREAEEEHQDYLQKHPHGYTCHDIRRGWKLPRRESQTA
jgi:peptide-methionine (S)-S-oxide reductase